MPIKKIEMVIVCFLLFSVAMAQSDQQSAKKTLTRQLVRSMTEACNQLSDSCRSAIVVLKFHLSQQGTKVDSVSIASNNNALLPVIDRKRLTAVDINWQLLLKSPVELDIFTMVQPVVLTGFAEECGPAVIALKDLTPVWELLGSESRSINKSHFLLEMAEIKYSKPVRKRTFL
ncbi:hypothetical protein [Pseudobacter ginsenosidimutans]|nr:hypothetical protein [Pseudobacter ginsenosidimutans]QEC43367.1 hypothetical protein FSB84_17300 [Pseudobacter ginsenosidimutans]